MKNRVHLDLRTRRCGCRGRQAARPRRPGARRSTRRGPHRPAGSRRERVLPPPVMSRRCRRRSSGMWHSPSDGPPVAAPGGRVCGDLRPGVACPSSRLGHDRGVLRRRRARAVRREAGSLDDRVRQIAEDKRRADSNRLTRASSVREVYLGVVDRLAEPLVRTGYRYARSGPHATRRLTHITSKVYFSSSHLNVAGELVVLHISLQVLDAQLGAWRRDQPTPRRTDDVVATWHLGHLLDPPRWLEWNLASARDRSATIADIETTLHDAGLEFIDVLVEDLLGAADPSTLAGRVDIEALIEYYVRAGRRDETPALSTRRCHDSTSRGVSTSSSECFDGETRASRGSSSSVHPTASPSSWCSSTCLSTSCDVVRAPSTGSGGDPACGRACRRAAQGSSIAGTSSIELRHTGSRRSRNAITPSLASG